VVEVIPTGTVTRGKMYRMDHKQGDRVTVPTRHTAALLDAWEWSELDPHGNGSSFWRPVPSNLRMGRHCARLPTAVVRWARIYLSANWQEKLGRDLQARTG
jgi:hypothetical protein